MLYKFSNERKRKSRQKKRKRWIIQEAERRGKEIQSRKPNISLRDVSKREKRKKLRRNRQRNNRRKISKMEDINF